MMIGGIGSDGLSLNGLLARVTSSPVGGVRTPRHGLEATGSITGPDGGRSEEDLLELSDAARRLQAADDDAAPRSADSTHHGPGASLTEEEQQEVEELKQRDQEVRRHEQSHQAAAGGYATSGPTYEYETGPDGKRYAVGGEVQIDTSPEDAPQATIRKMQQVRRAALAVAEPSAQDRAVAAQAAAQEQQARTELREAERDPSADGTTSPGSSTRGQAAQRDPQRGAALPSLGTQLPTLDGSTTATRGRGTQVDLVA